MSRIEPADTASVHRNIIRTYAKESQAKSGPDVSRCQDTSAKEKACATLSGSQNEGTDAACYARGNRPRRRLHGIAGTRPEGPVCPEGLCGERPQPSPRRVGRAHRQGPLVGDNESHEPVLAGAVSEHGPGGHVPCWPVSASPAP